MRRHNHHRHESEVGFDSNVIDRDFDDVDLDLALMRHQIVMHGAVTLHPDGDRRDGVYDPVPLHSHIPDGGEFLSKAQVRERARWKQKVKEEAEQWEREHAEETDAWYRVQREREEKWRRDHAREEMLRERYRREVSHRPAAWKPPPENKHEEMLRNMRVGDPPPKGIGRVWRNYLMISEDDISTNPALEDYPWHEVWRGHGMIILKRQDEPAPWYSSDVAWRFL